MELWTAFILGLIGSLHCAGMCGPLALALPAGAGAGRDFLVGRLAYNLGRVGTYALLGGLFGLFGKTFSLLGMQRWLSIALGAGILVTALFSRNRALYVLLVQGVSRLKRVFAGSLKNPAHTSLLLLGSLNGLLPCGLAYAACASAASRGGAISGAFYMFVFGLGTAPMMLAIALSGKPFQMSLRLRLQPLVPATVLVVGMLLVLRGLSLGVPYISPSLAGSAATARCH